MVVEEEYLLGARRPLSRGDACDQGRGPHPRLKEPLDPRLLQPLVSRLLQPLDPGPLVSVTSSYHH